MVIGHEITHGFDGTGKDETKGIVMGEQGWIPGLGVTCGLSLLLVLVLVPSIFSPGSPVFPSPQKPTHPNSNSILEVSPISILC